MASADNSSSGSYGGPPYRPPPPKSLPKRAASEPSHLASAVPFTVDINPLRYSQIRWFYQEPGKEWTPFCGNDSLSLEDARMVVESKNDDLMSKEISVLGDMYTAEVFRNSTTLKAIYWDLHEPWQVRRGTWFEIVKDQWIPLPEDEAVIIEEAHIRKDWREKAKADAQLSVWAQARSSPVTVKNNTNSIVVLHQVMVKNYEAIWIGDNDVLKVKKDITSRVLSKVGEKLGSKGLPYGSLRIIRGYKEHALYNDHLPPIGHLVFVIHGICQNMESSDIVKSTSDVRDTCTSVAKKHFPNKWKEKRVEFVPIEWRTWLSLDKGMLQSITPHTIKSLRKMLNDSVLDVMYYMSPRFGPEILDGFRWQLNKKYKDFIRHHPNFISNGGTISLFAHSLGSVMSYDLMYETCEAKGLLDKRDSMKKMPAQSVAQQTNDDSIVNSADDDSTDMQDCGDCRIEESAALFEELDQARLKVLELEQKLIRKKTLDFQVDHLFAVGSPLGLFIMLKEHESIVKKDFKGASSLLPSCVCRRIHNVHHPSDPVAYRIEPLINSLYSQIKPVKVDSAGSKPSQKSKGMAEGPRPEESTPPAARSGSGWFNMASSVIKGFSSSGTTTNNDQATKLADNKMYDDDSKLKPEERLKERLDFMLRESFAENSYFNSLTAHLCYWNSNDLAMYILLQIYTYQ